MVAIEVVWWRGNKDVSLLIATVPQVPKLEEYLEFTLREKTIKGKVTRVTYKLQERTNKVEKDVTSSDYQTDLVQVRINPN